MIKTKISIEEFGKLAFATLNTTELSRRNIELIAKDNNVDVPKLIWKQRVSRGIYFADKIVIEDKISDEELFTINTTYSDSGIIAYVHVKNKKTGQVGLLSCAQEEKAIERQTERLKELLKHI